MSKLTADYDFITNPKTIQNGSLNITQDYQDINVQIIFKLYVWNLTFISRSSLNASKEFSTNFAHRMVSFLPVRIFSYLIINFH